MVKQSAIYQTSIDAAVGGGYTCYTYEQPTLAALKSILQFEIVELQQTAHDEKYGELAQQIWDRITYLKQIISLFAVFKTEIDTVPCRIPLILAGSEVGNITVITVPVFMIRDPP